MQIRPYGFMEDCADPQQPPRQIEPPFVAVAQTA